MRPSFSALIIAKDEERDLPACLESLKGLADETVVVVDAASKDGTERLARAAGCKVLVRPFDDYARQRQAALDACTKDWVLWIDCDERVTPELREEILRALTLQDIAGPQAYEIPFRVRFLGRALRWGGLGSETHVRLFQRRSCRFIGTRLHESLEIGGEGIVGSLRGVIEHEPYRDLAEYLEKLDRYTALAARKKLEAGRRAGPLDHLVLPWELFRRVVLRLAFLDGWQGLTWAGLSAFHHWLKYAKLREMQKEGQR